MANADGIQKRYWLGEEGDDLKLSTVYGWFLAGNFKQPDDSLKMTLFFIAKNVLFGQPYDKKVTNWLFNLVDDLNAFNSFTGGHYVFKMTMHYLRHEFLSRNSKKRAQVLEVLEETDDKVRTDYWVGVDFNMSVGPQFIPLEKMKENNILLDDGDDVDDGGDGDDRAPIGKIPLKRKAPKQKKKTSVKKKQMKTFPITSLDEADPL
ncbi:hypothetical protein LWI29_019294 [Acer saccharum]|uniref:DUF1985 domain-containing protein n=1 Tax=Acer saccharum TaxID=4024 RepID=A0AA39SH44_ACESA|nr:hypothetical protein LWI29_019294 [Acer saccharum]